MDRIDAVNILGFAMLLSLMLYAKWRVETDTDVIQIEVKSVILRDTREDGSKMLFTVVWGADTSVRHRYWFFGHHNFTRGETYLITFKPDNPGGGHIKRVEAVV